MTKKTVILTALLCTMASGAGAQIFPGYPDLFGRQPANGQERALRVEYNIDFQYFFDYRNFNASQQVFLPNSTQNVARFSPSAIFRYDQNRNITHRAVVGFDLTKTLGEVPVNSSIYSESESDPSLSNISLLKDLFFYYRISARTGNGTLDFYAGIHPRNALRGEYTRAIFADDIVYYDPNLEGMTLQYNSPRFSAEISGDVIGVKGLDRLGSAMLFTAGSYRPLEWLSAGWSASWTHVSGSFFYSCDVDNALFNPYVKADFGSRLNMQELSLKAGPVVAFEYDRKIDEESPHFPLGAEAVLTARYKGFGLEDTFYYGDNLMTYMSSSYIEISNAAVYANTLYSGEEFYFTRRRVPTCYDRLELYYRPLETSFLKTRLSLIGHFITPAGEIGPFAGWQAKATLLFNLDSIRNRSESASPARRSTRRPSGPTLSL